MFEKLIENWDLYQQVMKEENGKPLGGYLPDRVQAYGLAFAGYFKASKADIIQAIGLKEEDFHYGNKLDIMQRVKAL